jgi:hypothetical protein
MEAVDEQPSSSTPGSGPPTAPTSTGGADSDARARLERLRSEQNQRDVKTWNVRNLTADAITLTGSGRPPFVIPAFGRRTLEFDPRTAFVDVSKLDGAYRIEVTENITPQETAGLIVFGLGFWLVPVLGVIALIRGDFSWLLIGLLVLVVAGLLAVALGKPWLRRNIVDAIRAAPRRAMNLLSLLLVLLFAVVVPAVTIYLGADLHDVVERAKAGTPTDGGTYDLTLLARGMQFLFIAAASVLPGLLYFQFDRERLDTLSQKFTRHVFRLDSSVTTEPALLAKYGFLMDEVFGRRRPAGRGRLLPGKLSPIVVATLVMVLGWLVTLLNPQIETITDQADVVSLFEPQQSAVTFAFLGAYVYALGALLRGYVRRDLRPKSYTDVTVRILTVIALAWLLQVLFPDETPVLLVFAFATGLVPQTAFTLLREAVQSSDATRDGSRLGQRWRRLWSSGNKDEPENGAEPSDGSGSPADLALPELQDPLPLTQLEGIDIYDRARLASEGITNIEALAHSDLIELMVQTRIPAPRLVDWVDQSILYLHVSRNDRVSLGQNETAYLSSYEVLRRVGIRTATDLIRASKKANERAEQDPAKNGFPQLLGPARDGGPDRLAVILDAIEDEEWMANLLHWHSQSASNGASDELHELDELDELEGEVSGRVPAARQAPTVEAERLEAALPGDSDEEF